MWHAANALEHFAAEATNAHLHAFDVCQRLDLFAIPAAHLCASVTAWEVHDVVLGVELAHQLHAVAFIHPSRHLTAVQTERNGTTQSESFVLTKEVVRGCVSHFNGALLHAINHAESGHQFTGCVHGNLKFATRHGSDSFGELISSAVDGVERLGEARSQAPADSGLRMHCGCCTSSQNTCNTCIFNNGTTVHE